MDGKFMKVKKTFIPTMTLVIIASQLMGCASASEKELLQMINKGEAIEIEVMAPINEELGEQSNLIWEELAYLRTNPDLRNEWDDILGILKNGEVKNGILYVNETGENEPNNTLRVSLHNRGFQKILEDKNRLIELSYAVKDNYVDLGDGASESKSVYMGINGYFNLLPDSEPNYCNANATLQRNEFMAMVFRAETPVQDIKEDSNFTSAVGKSEYNIYAQGVAGNSYLDLNSKSLDNMTYNGTITRAEAVYLLVSRYFPNEYKNADIKADCYSDCKDGGNVAQKQKFIEENNMKDYWKSYELTYVIQNPDNGMPTDLYKAMIVAKEKGIITSTESRWEEGVIRAEAIEMLVNTYLADDSISTFNYKNGIVEGYSDEEAQYNKEGEVVAEKSEMDAVINQTDENMEEPVAENPEPIKKETTDFEVESLSPTTLYAIQNVNLRQGPDSEDFSKTGSLSSRQQVTVTGVVKQYKGTDTLWYQLESGEFVAGSYLVENLPPQQTTTPANNNGDTQPSNNNQVGNNKNTGGLKLPDGARTDVILGDLEQATSGSGGAAAGTNFQ